MSSSATLYTVAITNGNSSNTAPQDGFVDNKRIEDYSLDLSTTPSGLTAALSQAKRRANIRYREIINQISLVTNGYVVDNKFTSDATYDTEATSFSFYIIIEHGDASLITADESNTGVTLTGAACLKRCIARALTNDMVRQEDWFDPTDTTSTPTTTTSVIRYGTRIWPGGTSGNTFEIGAYAADISTAESLISVNKYTF